MEYIKHAFLQNPSNFQIGLFATILLGLWLTEAIVLASSWQNKWRHTLTNMLFIFTALPLQLFMTIFVLMVSTWAVATHWGILFLFPHPQSFIVKYVIGFILLDFCEYVYHVIMHKIKPLWNFHLVHHSDLELDVSTTVREHPVETVIRMCFLVVWVFLLGASIGALILRQTLQTVSNITSHTQFRLSPKTNYFVSILFITPNLHHVHHHYELPFTDCNYGDILSIWDRIFKTYHDDRGLRPLKYGIDTCMDKNINSVFSKILKMPFPVGAKKPADTDISG